MREITYCLSCKKDTRNIDPRIVKTKNKFISQGSGLFDSLGLNNIIIIKIINMNNIINKFL